MNSLEEQLYDSILSKNNIKVNELIEKGVNLGKIIKGRTFLGIATEFGDEQTFNSLLNTIINQSSNYGFNSNPTSTKLTLNSHLDNYQTNKSSNKSSIKESKNLGYFVMVHNDLNDLNNSTSFNQFSSDTTPEGMDNLEWDIEINDTTTNVETSDQDPFVSLYKFYADILDKTADILKESSQILYEHYDINQQDKSGYTALHYAVQKNDINRTELLIKAGSNVNLPTSLNCSTPLHIACENNNYELCRLLILNRANVNARMECKTTPLHIASVRNNFEIVQLLVRNGAFLDVQNMNGRTPLSAAVLTESEDTVEYLINAGAKLNIENDSGQTALCNAVWQQSEKIVRMLLKSGARITQSHCLLHTAVMFGNETIVRLLLEAGSVPNICNSGGDYPLMIAVKKNYYQIAKMLLENGAFANQYSLDGNNLIHEAVQNIAHFGDFERMFQLLYSYGADINSRCVYLLDLTPLGRALDHAYLEHAAILIRHGADVNEPLEIIEQKSNLSYARQKGWISIVQLLVYAGANIYSSTLDLEHSDVREYDTSSVDGWLSFVKHNPLSLMSLCRIFIRRKLNGRIYENVNKLALPSFLKLYLKLEEL